MKRLFKVVGASLIALLTIMILGSCSAKQTFRDEILKEDSIMVTKMMAEVDNPTFTDVDEVLAYYHDEKLWKEQDSVFFSIPQKVIPDIVSVLQKNHDPVTKVNIANEFKNNKRIYLNLPDKSDMYESLTPPDIPNVKTVDTVINGKHVQITESASPDINVKVTNTEDQS